MPRPSLDFWMEFLLQTGNQAFRYVLKFAWRASKPKQFTIRLRSMPQASWTLIVVSILVESLGTSSASLSSVVLDLAAAVLWQKATAVEWYLFKICRNIWNFPAIEFLPLSLLHAQWNACSKRSIRRESNTRTRVYVSLSPKSPKWPIRHPDQLPDPISINTINSLANALTDRVMIHAKFFNSYSKNLEV